MEKVRIFANLSMRALGDFIGQAVVASSIKELFDDCELSIYYRQDRPYKEPVVSCIHNADHIFPVASDAPGLPIEYLFNGPFADRAEPWQSKQSPDIVLSGMMITDATMHSLPITILRPPDSIFPARRDELVALGLDPKRWVACVYWKEANYEYRGHNSLRIIYDPAPYLEVIRHIIEDLGGQVVRLGHPTPTQVPAIKGFVDLAQIPDSEALQLFAVSVSRFFIASGSGPASYGPAFGVPTAVTDQNICFGAWQPHDYILPQNIIYQGKLFRPMEAYDAGLLSLGGAPKEVAFHRNTALQLVKATDEMFHITTDCTGWRTLVTPPPPSPRPNGLTLPLPRGLRPELLIPPSQRQRR
jgi:putative glycosyltransferase (TIGR04372 family)